MREDGEDNRCPHEWIVTMVCIANWNDCNQLIIVHMSALRPQNITLLNLP
jgi:hypothetical protein